jgi:hypothetical protein
MTHAAANEKKKKKLDPLARPAPPRTRAILSTKTLKASKIGSDLSHRVVNGRVCVRDDPGSEQASLWFREKQNTQPP